MKRMLKIASIIGLAFVVALAVWTLVALRPAAATAETRVLLLNTRAACTSYFSYYGQWPASLSDLDHNPSNIVFILWPKSGPNDRWGRSIQYKAFKPALGYGSLTSYGRDGRAGGE